MKLNYKKGGNRGRFKLNVFINQNKKSKKLNLTSRSKNLIAKI